MEKSEGERLVTLSLVPLEAKLLRNADLFTGTFGLCLSVLPFFSGCWDFRRKQT